MAAGLRLGFAASGRTGALAGKAPPSIAVNGLSSSADVGNRAAPARPAPLPRAGDRRRGGPAMGHTRVLRGRRRASRPLGLLSGQPALTQYLGPPRRGD